MSEFGDTFRAAQRAAFGFLSSEYGFTCLDVQIKDDANGERAVGVATYTEPGPWYRGKARRRFVELSCVPTRLEVELVVGRGRNRFTLHDLHQFEGMGRLPLGSLRLYEASKDVDALRAEFADLARALLACGKRFLEGDELLWRDLRQWKRAALEDAIRSNDYCRAAELHGRP